MLAGRVLFVAVLGSAVRRGHLEKAGMSPKFLNYFQQELSCLSTTVFVVKYENMSLHITILPLCECSEAVKNNNFILFQS